MTNVTGFFAKVADAQKQSALAYRGPENHGDWPDWARNAVANPEKQINPEKQTLKNGRFAPGHGGGPGRKKGVPNKTTTALREAILAAGEAAGGKDGLVGYLRGLAISNSSAYASLLGKVLPTTLEGSGSGGEFIHKIVREVVDPRAG